MLTQKKHVYFSYAGSRGALFFILGCMLFSCEKADLLKTAQASENGPERKSLVSMARLEPASGTLSLASALGDTVDRILVKEGTDVRAGQPLLRLTSHRLRQAELEAAQLSLERARLQTLDVEAQEARLRAADAELESAQSEVTSQEELSQKGFTAGTEFRAAELRVLKAKEERNQVRALLERYNAESAIALVEAENSVEQAEARVEQSLIRSPIDARVLRIHARPGEFVSSRAIISLGQTENMVAIGEIHVNEIRMVEIGQKASFTSAALTEPLQGQVAEIGEMILSNNVFGEDPRAPRGLRVVQVRVELEKNALAKRLTNLDGQLRIYLEDQPSH